MKTDKVANALGRDTVEEMDAMNDVELKKVIVDANGAMKQVKEELDANQAYQAAKADVSHLSQGKRDVDKRQKAKIAYALDRIEGLGKLDQVGLDSFFKTRAEYQRKQEKRRIEKLEEEVEAAAKTLGLKASVNASMSNK